MTTDTTGFVCPNCGGVGHRDAVRRLPSGTVVTIGRPCQICEGRGRVGPDVLARWRQDVLTPRSLRPWRS